ncbi:MAG: phosphatase PAP2 family protein [Bacteroidaceae bacterium]|nr:phosphatase PAP2 family protein [Bacteroidaceae bacterium]
MFKKTLTITLLLLVFLLPANARLFDSKLIADSLRVRDNWNSFSMNIVAPLTLVGTSTIWGDYLLEDKIILNGHNHNPVNLNIANYIQYTPMAILYASKVFGLPGRYTWQQDLIVHAGASLLALGINQSSKHLFRRMRPDERSRSSYPSGHSVTAFMTAHCLHKEYGETISPWFSVAGYSFAVATGAMRVIQKRHHISDVLCGAGMGIFIAELGYTICDMICYPSNSKSVLNKDRSTAIDKWDFSMNSSYMFGVSAVSDSYLNNYGDFKPSYTLGLEALRMFSKNFGAGIRADITEYFWQNTYVDIADYSRVAPQISGYAGVAARIPATGFLIIGADAMAGVSARNNYHFTCQEEAIDINIPTSFSTLTQISLQFNTSKMLAISAFAGYKYTHLNANMFYTGTAVHLHF